MDDNKPVVTQDTPIEEKKDEKKEEPILKQIRGKSWQKVIKEDRDRKIKEKLSEKEEKPHVPEATVEPKEEAPVEKKEPEKESIDLDKIKKEAEEAAERKVQEALTKREEEAKRREDEERSKKEKEQAEEKEKENLTPPWVKENRDPKDYNEIYEQAMKVSDHNFQQKLKERDTKQEELTAAQQKEQDEIRARNEREATEYKAELDTDMKDLYVRGLMPEIKDPTNPNDPGVIAQNELYKKGIEVNQERISKGEPAIRSIKLIYYEHYKANKQPAGADAPVMGNGTPPKQPEKEDKYTPEDRKKGWSQFLKDMRGRK